MDDGKELLKTNVVEHPSSELFNPKGHPPLVYLEGQLFRTSTGQIVKSEWPLGPQSFHKDLFIEYERTFGRGLAKDITHGLGFSSTPANLKGHVDKLQKEYEEIAININSISFSGYEQDVKEEIQKIREYRAKYPDLYIDVVDELTGHPKIKFTII